MALALTNLVLSLVTMVTKYTGGLSQLLLVKMSWEKKAKQKPIIEMLTPGHQGGGVYG